MINKTYGRYSEIKDFWDILMDNLTIGGKDANTMSLRQIIDALKNGLEPELDLDQFMQDLLLEEIMDMMIGQLSQAEKNWLLEKFPLDHPLLNVWGNPTTWARRLGYDVYDPALKYIKTYFGD